MLSSLLLCATPTNDIAGRCNVALFSFTKFKSQEGKLSNPSPELAWSDIINAGLKLDNECLTNKEGGAIVVKGWLQHH